MLLNFNLLNKIIAFFQDSFGLFSIRALFTSDSHRVISREGIEEINKVKL